MAAVAGHVAELVQEHGLEVDLRAARVGRAVLPGQVGAQDEVALEAARRCRRGSPGLLMVTASAPGGTSPLAKPTSERPLPNTGRPGSVPAECRRQRRPLLRTSVR